jgi:hypothetical protein
MDMPSSGLWLGGVLGTEMTNCGLWLGGILVRRCLALGSVWVGYEAYSVWF